MNNVDYDPEIAERDAYGNVTRKDQCTAQSIEEQGFYNVPAECEDCECCDCPFSPDERKELDCPYLED